jgi:hypothetical protein
VLALAAANAVGVALYGTVYVLAATGRLAQPAFLACLPLVFVLVTAVWVRTEARHRALEPVRRFGRAAAGLAGVVVATPMVVLMPLFWLDTQLPAEAGLRAVLGPAMALVLIALALTVLHNVAGGLVIAVRGLVLLTARR